MNALAADVKQQAWNKETMRAGQDIVLTKWIGLEGTLRILDEKRRELGKRFSGTFFASGRGIPRDHLRRT